MSSALGFSYDSRNFTAFGQRVISSAAMKLSPPPPPTVGTGPLLDTNVGSRAYFHSYGQYKNVTAAALACQAECASPPSVARFFPVSWCSTCSSVSQACTAHAACCHRSGSARCPGVHRSAQRARPGCLYRALRFDLPQARLTASARPGRMSNQAATRGRSAAATTWPAAARAVTPTASAAQGKPGRACPAQCPRGRLRRRNPSSSCQSCSRLSTALPTRGRCQSPWPRACISRITHYKWRSHTQYLALLANTTPGVHACIGATVPASYNARGLRTTAMGIILCTFFLKSIPGTVPGIPGPDT